MSTSALADRLGGLGASATTMLKKLAALGLVEPRALPRRRADAQQGEQAAIEVIRHHRLLEQYLAERLGVPIDDVHAEADRLEHALSEELEARIDASSASPRTTRTATRSRPPT